MFPFLKIMTGLYKKKKRLPKIFGPFPISLHSAERSKSSYKQEEKKFQLPVVAKWFDWLATLFTGTCVKVTFKDKDLDVIIFTDRWVNIFICKIIRSGKQCMFKDLWYLSSNLIKFL